MTTSRNHLFAVVLFSLVLSLGGCQTMEKSQAKTTTGSVATQAGSADLDASALLRAAQDALHKGDAAQALATYKQVGMDSASPEHAAAAMMGRFMLRIDPQGAERNPDQARAIARELAAFAEQSQNPVAGEFARAAEMRLEVQRAINTLVADARELQATRALLQEKDQELKKKEEAIQHLKKVLISN